MQRKKVTILPGDDGCVKTPKPALPKDESCVKTPDLKSVINWSNLFKQRESCVVVPKKEQIINAATDAFKTWIGFGKKS